MTESHNPFAPPKASLEPGSHQGCWAEDKLLIARPNTVLPPRCVKCNQPAELPMKKRNFRWHHPAYYLLVLVNILIYVIVAVVVQKQAKVTVGLCRFHRRRRFQTLLACWLAFLFGIVLIIASAIYHFDFLIIPGVILIPVGLIFAVLFSRLLTPVGIDKSQVRLKGCGKAFLESLPTFQS